ncbi:hypothetical protein NQ317_006396 [Molorchus minor]|uniref:Uncharacterized protein n=1 Tax=Molorchus minor TaxID=1323400 RepID=A0ABQ9IZX9_9CUCU|nr:hypothetical protein NQ317_006396 [Molorchus minor]
MRQALDMDIVLKSSGEKVINDKMCDRSENEEQTEKSCTDGGVVQEDAAVEETPMTRQKRSLVDVPFRETGPDGRQVEEF